MAKNNIQWARTFLIQGKNAIYSAALELEQSGIESNAELSREVMCIYASLDKALLKIKVDQ